MYSKTKKFKSSYITKRAMSLDPFAWVSLYACKASLSWPDSVNTSLCTAFNPGSLFSGLTYYKQIRKRRQSLFWKMRKFKFKKSDNSDIKTWEYFKMTTLQFKAIIVNSKVGAMRLICLLYFIQWKKLYHNLF